MRKKPISTTKIASYWWNFGKKTLDFNCTMPEALKHKAISYKAIRSKQYPDKKGFRFSFDVSNSSITMDLWTSFDAGAIEALRTLLLLLGDKSTLIVYSRVYRINH